MAEQMYPPSDDKTNGHHMADGIDAVAEAETGSGFGNNDNAGADDPSTQVEEIPIKKTGFKAPSIDFGYLWKEFKNFNSNHQEPTQNLNSIDRFRLNNLLNYLVNTLSK